ncbi:PAS domain-containing protein [Paraburkholderia sp. DGU8]|uniref:PAS domain-containing protein n=1 Tax=Paraburkholderia sp. DGU8 TaxID=3161997 RepID=UPI0034667E3B
MSLAGKTPFISGGSRGIRLLRQRNQTLEVMSARFPGHVWTAYPDGSPEYLTQSIREYTGIQISNNYANYDDVIHPDDVAANEHYWEALSAGRDADELELRIRRADGVYRWFLCRTRAVRGMNGAIVRWVCLNWDIHDRKIAELRLRSEGQNYKTKEVIPEREAQLDWLIDAVPGFIWTTDAAGSIEYVSKQGEAYTGRSLHELTINGWFDLVHPDDYATVTETWDQSVKSGTTYDTVHRLRAADGSYRWFQCRANAMRNARGDITNWYGLLTDIHERKIGEERLRREELHLRRLVDAMPAMIWRATPGGEIDRWNRRMLSFIGKTWEEIDGKT